MEIKQGNTYAMKTGRVVFTVKVLSIGKNSLMVSVKSADMKHPVTRHLRKTSDGVYTGVDPKSKSKVLKEIIGFDFRQQPEALDNAA